MSPEALLVSLHTDTGEGLYRFACPKCREPVEKRADRRIVALLKAVGVEMVFGGQEGSSVRPTAPPQAAHAPKPGPEGPPFTADDLITWHFVLEDDESLAQFLSAACS